jgi:hypothetical protein
MRILAAAILLTIGSGGLALAQNAPGGGLTEAHARSALTDAGCSQIGNLSRDSKGGWHTTCWKGGLPTAMMVDASGKVSAEPGHTEMSEAHARSALTDAGCSQIGNLSQDSKGVWRGTCWKGGNPVAMMVDPSGKASPESGGNELSEAHARSIMMDSGCSNVSNLSRDSKGIWVGMCTKGGVPTQVAVDQNGKMTTR